MDDLVRLLEAIKTDMSLTDGWEDASVTVSNAITRIRELEEALDLIAELPFVFVGNPRPVQLRMADIAQEARGLPVITPEQERAIVSQHDRIRELEALVSEAREEIATIRDYVVDALSGVLQYRGKVDLSEMAREDLERIDAILARMGGEHDRS